LDGENSRQVVRVDVYPSSGTTNLIGLKITRGSCSGHYCKGAGIRVHSELTITNCLISDNVATDAVSTLDESHMNSLLFVFEC